MKRTVNNKDILVYALNKSLAAVPDQELGSIDEFKDFLRKEIAKPQSQVTAETKKIVDQARKELENATYLY